MNPWTTACHTPLSSTISWSLLKFMSIESVMLSNHLILCHISYSQFSLVLGSFPMSQLFASGDQSTGTMASASVSLMTIQGRFPLGLTGLIPFWSKGLSSVFSSTRIQKHQFFRAQLSLWSSSHICTWLLEKP